jgi:hypothetical protein
MIDRDDWGFITHSIDIVIQDKASEIVEWGHLKIDITGNGETIITMTNRGDETVIDAIDTFYMESLRDFLIYALGENKKYDNTSWRKELNQHE